MDRRNIETRLLLVKSDLVASQVRLGIFFEPIPIKNTFRLGVSLDHHPFPDLKVTICRVKTFPSREVLEITLVGRLLLRLVKASFVGFRESYHLRLIVPLVGRNRVTEVIVVVLRVGRVVLSARSV